jgi:hypothetical protein
VIGRGRRAVGGILLTALAVNAALWAACDDGDGTTFNRVSETGGNDATADTTPSSDATADGAAADDGGDAAADADGGDGEAGPPGPITFATGSGESPSPTVGYGDHTCVIAGAERSVYCWGANDHGQLGAGTSGDGGTTVDVASATTSAACSAG